MYQAGPYLLISADKGQVTIRGVKGGYSARLKGLKAPDSKSWLNHAEDVVKFVCTLEVILP